MSCWYKILCWCNAADLLEFEFERPSLLRLPKTLDLILQMLSFWSWQKPAFVYVEGVCLTERYNPLEPMYKAAQIYSSEMLLQSLFKGIWSVHAISWKVKLMLWLTAWPPHCQYITLCLLPYLVCELSEPRT